MLAAFALTCDLGVPQAVRALGQYFVGYSLCQGAVDDARQEVADDVPGPDGRGMNGVQDAAFRGRDVDRLETSVVVRHLGADRTLYPEGGVRGGVVEDDV